MATEKPAAGSDGDEADFDVDGFIAAGLDWLPVGSVVNVKGAESPMMIAGIIVRDAATDRYWDYLGYPCPQGYSTRNPDYFFDRDMVTGVLQTGFYNQAMTAFQVNLALVDEEYRKVRRAQDASGPGDGGPAGAPAERAGE